MNDRCIRNIGNGLGSTYIPTTMYRHNTVTGSLVLLILLMVPRGAESEEFTLDFLLTLDREVSTLLSAYLEAVPECPARDDTPLRLWVLDTAWLRTRAVLDRADSIDFQSSTGLPPETWTEYLEKSSAYLLVFGSIQEAYHSETLPDSMACVQLELLILETDSIWRSAELDLFNMLSEEGYNE